MDSIKTIGLEISKLHRLMERDFVNKLSKIICKDISVSQSQIIVYIASRKAEDTNQKDIENEFDLKCSSVSLLISDLEKNGYIVREKKINDARTNNLKLTSKANELCNVIRDLMESVNIQHLKDVSEEELELFLKVLTKVRNSIVNGREIL